MTLETCIMKNSIPNYLSVNLMIKKLSIELVSQEEKKKEEQLYND